MIKKSSWLADCFLHQAEPLPSISPDPSTMRLNTFSKVIQLFPSHSSHASIVLGATTFPNTCPQPKEKSLKY